MTHSSLHTFARLFVIAVTIVVLIGLWAFVNRTNVGLIIRAGSSVSYAWVRTATVLDFTQWNSHVAFGSFLRLHARGSTTCWTSTVWSSISRRTTA